MDTYNWFCAPWSHICIGLIVLCRPRLLMCHNWSIMYNACILFSYWLNYFSVITLRKYKNNRKTRPKPKHFRQCPGKKGHKVTPVYESHLNRASVYFDSVLLTSQISVWLTVLTLLTSFVLTNPQLCFNTAVAYWGCIRVVLLYNGCMHAWSHVHIM